MNYLEFPVYWFISLSILLTCVLAKQSDLSHLGTLFFRFLFQKVGFTSYKTDRPVQTGGLAWPEAALHMVGFHQRSKSIWLDFGFELKNSFKCSL